MPLKIMILLFYLSFDDLSSACSDSACCASFLRDCSSWLTVTSSVSCRDVVMLRSGRLACSEPQASLRPSTPPSWEQIIIWINLYWTQWTAVLLNVCVVPKPWWSRWKTHRPASLGQPLAAAPSSTPPGRSSLPEGVQPVHAAHPALHSDWSTSPGRDVINQQHKVIGGHGANFITSKEQKW